MSVVHGNRLLAGVFTFIVVVGEARPAQAQVQVLEALKVIAGGVGGNLATDALKYLGEKLGIIEAHAVTLSSLCNVGDDPLCQKLKELVESSGAVKSTLSRLEEAMKNGDKPQIAVILRTLKRQTDRFESDEKRLDKLGISVTNLETAMGAMERRVEDHERRVEDHERRLRALEAGREQQPLQIGAEPTMTPPTPPLVPPARKSDALAALRLEAPQSGQWVYTTQEGWIWMPYGSQYAEESASTDATPYQYVYSAARGWAWVPAPWLWGQGPFPYFGAGGASRFGWYRGLFKAGGWGWGHYPGHVSSQTL